jgi:hypothetical protein
VGSWETAARSHGARAAVLAVVTPEDRPAAVTVATRLAALKAAPMVCTGGASGADLVPGVRTLAPSIGSAAAELDDLTYEAGK